MNWLAHIFLSENDPEFRLGNLLPDFTRVRPFPTLPAQIMRGVECHQRIDTFTDHHAITRRSIGRIGGGYRRVGGILVDIFYDHFLASTWQEYSPTPLPQFTNDVYASFEPLYPCAPEECVRALRTMRAEDSLSSYATLQGIETTLMRVSKRLRGRIDLAPAVKQLEQNYEALTTDFKEFFPQLRTHVSRRTN